MSATGTIYWQMPQGGTVTGSEILGPIRQNNQDVSLTIAQFLAPETSRATAAESSLGTRITNEMTRATGAESILSDAISAEITRATGVEGTLSSSISSEATRAEGAEATITTSVTTERTRAEAAEAANATAISNEVTRASGVESTLSNAISTETTRAETAESAIATSVTTERTRAEGVESTLATQAALNSEISRAEGAESGLFTQITNEVTRATNAESALSSAIGSETSRAEAAESAITSGIPGAVSSFLTGLPTSPGSGAWDNGNVTCPAASYPDPKFQRSSASAPVDLLTITGRVFVPQEFGTNVGTGGDDTPAIQAAINAAHSSGGGTVYFAAGTYHLSATLTCYAGVNLQGSGGYITILQRSSNYGDTIRYGSSGVAAGTFFVRDLWFNHGTFPAPGDTTLTDPVSSTTAHIRVTSGQFCWIERCWFWRLPYGIVYDGTVLSFTSDNSFHQINDPTNSNLQEGIAGVWFGPTSANNQLAKVTRNYFAGTGSASRNITYNDGVSPPVTVNLSANIGPQYHILVNGCEDAVYSDNYFGGAASNSIALAPNSSAFGVFDQRILGNFFDAAGNNIAGSADVAIDASGSGVSALGVSITGNVFNGETVGLCGVYVTSNGTAPSVYNLTISGNTFFAYVATPIYVFGASRANISGNTVNGYNCLQAAQSSGNQAYNSGIYIGEYSVNCLVFGNIIGGGITSDTGYCYYGTVITSTNGCTQFGNTNAGVLTNFGTQVSNVTNQFNGEIGFFNAAPVGQNVISGSYSGGLVGVVQNIVYVLAQLGLAADHTTS